MPETLVVGNWKMNTNLGQALELAAGIGNQLKDMADVRAVLCPPFPFLSSVGEALRGSAVKLGAQNMHWEDSGAFTGEVAPQMLQGLCEYVILGHSERRQLFGETDELINRKVQSALSHGLQPILCVGETLDQRESGQATSVVAEQVRRGLAEVVDISSLVVAYEPVWAIGSGLAATPEIAAEVMSEGILQVLRELYADAGAEVPLLYGGSVNPSNIGEFAAQSSIHGALVGGASLQASQFVQIVNLALAAKSPPGN
jgi:triosephosphate isomerase